MANALYQEGKRAIGNKEIQLSVDTLTVLLIASGYTFSQSHTSVSASITSHVATAGGVAHAASVALGSVTWSSAAVLGAANSTFSTINGGQTIIGIVVAKGDTPIAYIDTGAGFPFTSSGGDVSVDWSGSGVFQL